MKRSASPHCCEADGIGVVVIGAVALAAHRYVRFTRDVDLGVNADGMG